MYKVFSDFFLIYSILFMYLAFMWQCGNHNSLLSRPHSYQHCNKWGIKTCKKLTFSCKVGEVDWSIIHNRHGMHIKNSSYMWVCPVILKMLLTRVKIVYSQFILTKSLCDLLNFECYILKSWQIPYVWITGTIVAVVPVLNTFLSYLVCFSFVLLV